MRISDWSSDVCSSDLGEFNDSSHGINRGRRLAACVRTGTNGRGRERAAGRSRVHHHGGTAADGARRRQDRGDRKSVVWGKRVSVRVDLGGSRIIKQQKNRYNDYSQT